MLLGSRQDAKGITDALTADQKKIVLQVLALKLMKRGIREFSPKQEEEQENSLIEIIQNQLAQVTSDEIKPKDFLEQVEKISGLLVEKEKGVYGFAHKSFQEYLAAVEIIKTNQENILTENISNIWWQETIRLYAAQSDASNLITAALNEDTVAALKLALDCQEEGLIIKPEVRQQLREKLDKGLESSEPEVFKLAVEVKLAKRLSQVLRIDEERAIDNSYITCAEYQLFVNELQNSESSFPGKNAKQPAIIENWSDAIDFCGWFSEKANSNLIANQLTDQKYYRLPQGTEIANHLANEHRGLECWNFEEDLAASKGIRLVQTKTRNIFGFDVITVNNQGQETQRKRRYAKYVTEKLGNGIDLDMVAIPGGTFMMGSLEGEGSSNEKPQHEVTVQPFALGKYPITQAQYQGVMGINPSYFKGNEQRPVECVSWNDAVEFCQRLSGQTGKEYRLPSEAEWEYACRAGTTTKYYFGDDITSDLANYDGNVGETTSVGQYSPNAFGLYDMHGNVWEWCQDKWHDNYQDAPNDGRAWVSGGISIFVLRGGSWDGFPRYCRSAYRGRDVPDDTVNDLGFRVACGGART